MFSEEEREAARVRARKVLEARQRLKREERAFGIPKDAFLRAPNEDDDGYDPYSDRVEVPKLFEPNPWD